LAGNPNTLLLITLQAVPFQIRASTVKLVSVPMMIFSLRVGADAPASVV
jgi:hypothetical protein